MKKSWKNILFACLFFSLAFFIAGCNSTGKNGKMDDSMPASMETMEKEQMHDTMGGSMDMKEDKKTDKMRNETMQDPMK